MIEPSTAATATVANCVRALRVRRGLRQSDLAGAVGVTRQTILAIEKGRLNPSILICLRIAATLEVPVDALFTLQRGHERPVGDDLAARGASAQN